MEETDNYRERERGRKRERERQTYKQRERGRILGKLASQRVRHTDRESAVE